MSRDTEHDDYAPLTHWGEWPVHVTTVVVLACVGGMVTGALCQAFAGGNLVVDWLAFSLSKATLQFQVWRVLTYPLAGALGFGFIINMLVMFVAGRELERFLGRRAFTRLLCLLIAAAPVASSLIALAVPDGILAGPGPLVLGVCVAFATVYPNTGIVFGIANKWIVGVLIAFYSLQSLAAHDFGGLAVIMAMTMLGHLFIRHARGELESPAPRRPPKTKPAPPRPRRRPDPPRAPEDDPETVDRVLEKISRHGLGSLTDDERALLDRASRKLAGRS